MPGTPYGLSVSSYEETPERADWIIETGLWDTTTDSLIHDVQLGYSDILRFSTVDELLAEIARIHAAVTAPGFAAP